MQGVENPYFEQLLIGDPDLDRIALGTSFLEPAVDERDIVHSASLSAALVERRWSPVELDALALGGMAYLLWLPSRTGECPPK